MRILVDHSGYDLLNLGDVAMLQSCVRRLATLWPDAEILVICRAPDRLAQYCPGAVPVALDRTEGMAGRRLLQHVPRRARHALGQAWRIAGPSLVGHGPSRSRPAAGAGSPLEALAASDLVIAAGGGYVTDTWWWHAAGVLSLLSAAQRTGRPTAMLGQGLGPINHPLLRYQARKVLPRLERLGLREGVVGPPLARAFGVPDDRVVVTGDDALEVAVGTPARGGDAIGVNLRVSAYAGLDDAAGRVVTQAVARAARAFDAPLVMLPVSRYPEDGDLAALVRTFAGVDASVTADDLADPDALVEAVHQCRAVVTGSYHAAVFSLAQGVPVVCLTRSSYYDAKFTGLAALFPTACTVVDLTVADFPSRLAAAIEQAWRRPAIDRQAAYAAAVAQRERGRETYGLLRASLAAAAIG
jgi:colanic acid/amylovoran biosynthesis protein